MHCNRYFPYTQDMTLHETTENFKKGSIATAIGIGSLLLIVMIFRVGITIKNILFPPTIEPPNMAYGQLPSLTFPVNVVEGDFVYKINTASGNLPEDFPDRLNVYPIVKDSAGLLNLKTVESKIKTLGFLDSESKLLPGTPLGDGDYEWSDPSGTQKNIVFNIVTFNFTLTSNYVNSNAAREGRTLSTQQAAIQTVQSYLTTLELFPEDIDIEKTKNPDPELNYITFPQLYGISQDGILTPSTSLLEARVIRVDLYQKNVQYELNTGISNDKKELQKVKVDLPILYPHPPHSAMNFFVAAGVSDAEVSEAHFFHQKIDLKPEIVGTYPIKSPEEAFEELKAGKAYIAAFAEPGDSQILISKVYLAYYLDEKAQDYLMPIIVFEGQKGFFAYVSAVKEDFGSTAEEASGE